MTCRPSPQLLSLLVGLLATGMVRAGTLEKFSFDRLRGEADLVVRGRIEDVKTRPSPDGSHAITVVTASISHHFKGPKVSSLTIEQPGGSLGDVTLAVPGSPEFAQGEEVILFLKRHRRGALRVVGGKQGKFMVKTSPGDRAVVEDFAHRVESLDSFLARLAPRDG